MNHTGRELYEAGKSALTNIRKSRPVQRAIEISSEVPEKFNNFRDRRKQRQAR